MRKKVKITEVRCYRHKKS